MAKPFPPEIQSNALEVSVSELSNKLKRTVEDAFGSIRVRGEISGFRGPHSSGHCYFSLKDQKARLEAVIWRGQAAKMKHLPEEGLEVIASGKLTTYPGSSKYQIVIDHLEPAGAGALMALLEERRKKLAAEGLFEEHHKKTLPFMPKVIGVITSPTGAVIRDILHRIRDRFPVHVVVWPARVQGETSSREVQNGVEQFNKIPLENSPIVGENTEHFFPIPRPDLLIIARGGGSLEDLWGFNDEALVRAVFHSNIPVISAVGHETDWTLIDHVADWRAPTPTAAAEKAVPVKADYEAFVADLGARLRGAMRRLHERRAHDLRSLERGLKTPDMLLAMPRRQFDENAARLERALISRVRLAQHSFAQNSNRLSPLVLGRILSLAQERLQHQKQGHEKSLTHLIKGHKERFTALARAIRPAPLHNKLTQTQDHFQRIAHQLAPRMAHHLHEKKENHQRLTRLLQSFSYHSVLARGFAVIRDQNNTPLTHIAPLAKGAPITIEMQDGRIEAFTGSHKGPARNTRSSPPKAKAKPHDDRQDDRQDDQGNLF